MRSRKVVLNSPEVISGDGSDEEDDIRGNWHKEDIMDVGEDFTIEWG